MKIKVGLDIGGSTTKIVGMRNGGIIASEIVKAADPVTSAFGAVGKEQSAKTGGLEFFNYNSLYSEDRCLRETGTDTCNIYLLYVIN